MFQKLPPVITGTLYLSAAGVITRLLGFFYKIWLGKLIGAEELGIYQLIFPVFILCMSICGGPFQTAISKFTAQYHEHEPFLAKWYLRICLFFSSILSFLCTAFILLFHRPIATFFLLNERCSNLLFCMAFSIPLSAIHSCITGWYYGQKKTAVPAWSNLIEQGIRILFVFFLVKTNQPFHAAQVVWALIAGELAAAVFTVILYLADNRKYNRVQDISNQNISVPVPPSSVCIKCIPDIFAVVCPLTANRLIMNLLQSVESVMIPSRLLLYGMTENAALTMYGTLTGMSMNFIMFPTAFTASFSLMLMPDIAQACAEHRTSYVQKASSLSLRFTFFIGCLFTAFFFLFGESIGDFCFPGTLSGTYIRSLAWLCPFLYLNNVLTSILHGMEMTALTFKTQLAGLILRLGVTVFLVPLFGINCYFLALLGSQLLMCGLNLLFLRKKERL